MGVWGISGDNVEIDHAWKTQRKFTNIYTFFIWIDRLQIQQELINGTTYEKNINDMQLNMVFTWTTTAIFLEYTNILEGFGGIEEKMRVKSLKIKKYF